MKPLHVRVAEALGWTHLERGGLLLPDSWVGFPPSGLLLLQQVPFFDREWSAAGPLIEKYEIHVHTGWHACLDTGCEAGEYEHGPVGSGETPVLAVCDLILALAAANKLPEVAA